MTIPRAHWPLLAAICASLFTTPLMAAGVNAILPELGRSLHAGATELGLIGAAYSLGLAVFQLACGSLGDIWGHKRIFLIGTAIFGTASLAGAVITQMTVFLLLRFVQGVGGAMMSASGLALLASAAPPGQRTTYLGISGCAVYGGIACGPPIAGLIAGNTSWQWLFIINSICAIAIILLMAFGSKHDLRTAPNKRFDWQGCGWYAISMTALTAASAIMGASTVMGLMGIAIFLAALALFARRQTKAAFPILNLSLLSSNHLLALSCIAALVNYASFFGIIFYFSIYLQIAHNLNVQMAGITLAFQPFMQAIAQPVATRLCNAWSKGATSATGAALCGFGLLASAFLSPASPLSVLMLAQGLLGSGMSLFALANTAIILESAGPKYIGQASALTGAMRTCGQLISMCMITLSLSLFLGSESVGAHNLPAFMTSMKTSLIIFGLLNLAAVGTIFARNSHPAD